MLGEHKVYTSSCRMSIHPVFGGSRYRYLCFSILVVGVYRRARRGGAPKFLMRGWTYGLWDWSSKLSFGRRALALTTRSSGLVEYLCSPFVKGSSVSRLTSCIYRPRQVSPTGSLLGKELLCHGKIARSTPIRLCLFVYASVVQVSLAGLFMAGGEESRRHHYRPRAASTPSCRSLGLGATRRVAGPIGGQRA